MKNFIRYIEDNKLVTTRLLHVLKRYSERYDIPVADITKKDFFQLRGSGEVTWQEFETLRAQHLANVPIPETPVKVRKNGSGGARKNAGGARVGAGRKPMGTDGKTKIMYKGLRLRSDVVEILKKEPSIIYYIENAVLEKWKRENE